jgi:RecQ family ATP-dependent DNA helicase
MNLGVVLPPPYARLVTAFTARATELLPRLAADRMAPEITAELQALRTLWRSLSDGERAEAAPVAEALAAAQAPPPPQAALFEDDDAAARRAITGLDRINVDATFETRYHGRRDPDALLSHFGLESFRPGQRDAVAAALDGRDCLVVMPTGGGKSLCYQLPGIASDDLTVVVSPLIALMADQYRRLRLGGHPVAMIASGMEAGAQANAMEDVRSGRARIVLCSPERFASTSFLAALAQRRVDLFVVDEAHCVSEWGHDFRPDYLRLHGAIERLGRPAVMACTATATTEVGSEIAARLGLRDPHVLRAGFDRPNLSFDVIPLEGTGSKARKTMLLSLILGDPTNRPAIVYCGTRKDVDQVTDALRADGRLAVGYHAGMAADERAAAQTRFMSGDAEIVVATNAFGMGVDKADVRAVIHWAIPKSVEAYYQEVGRGGRDGRPARAILLSSRSDLGRLINFITRDAVEPDQVMALVRRLNDQTVIDAPSQDRDRVALGIAERAGLIRLLPAPGGRLSVTLGDRESNQLGAVAAICRQATDRAWRAYHAVKEFSSSSESCRRQTLLTHFGDARPPAPTGRCCDVCDPDTVGLPDPTTLTPPTTKRKRRAEEPSTPLTPEQDQLVDALRAWRLDAAQGKPAYTIAHNRTLETIARLQPASLDELAEISGVGPTFIERHGAHVLAVVSAEHQ